VSNSRDSGFLAIVVSYFLMDPDRPVNVGIDLGTTNSCIACVKNNEIEAVAMPGGERLLPSAASYARENPVFGRIINNYIKQGRTDLARYSKRVMGKGFNSPEVKELKDQFGCPLIEVNHKPVYEFKNGVRKTPEEVGADIVEYLLSSVKRFTERKIGDVCVTIPAQFDNNQRTATINAVKKAGIAENHIHVISEPTAAAISYLNVNPMQNGRLLIFDFGGGTFDVSIIRVNNNRIIVEANRGNNHLGGLDIDYAILKWMKTEYNSLTGKELPEKDRNGTNKPLLKLLAIAERAKIDLSVNPATDIYFEGIQNVDPDFCIQLTQAKLGFLIQSFVDKAMAVIKDALNASSLSRRDIDDVILVGGSTRILVLREAILKYFNLQPRDNVNVDTIVAEGACAFFAYNGMISDRTSHSLGQLMGMRNVQCVIPMDSPLPASYTVEARVRTSMGWAVTYLYQGKATQVDELSSTDDCVSLSPFYYDVSEFEDEDTITVETSFTIKESGVVFLTVKEKETGTILLNDKMIKYEWYVCLESLSWSCGYIISLTKQKRDRIVYKLALVEFV